MCEVCGLDDRLRLLAGIGDQQSVFFSYHFRKVFLCFGILAAEQNGKLKVAQHSFPFVFAVNHIEVGQGLSQHHNTDVALSQFAQGLGDLQLAELNGKSSRQNRIICLRSGGLPEKYSTTGPVNNAQQDRHRF